MELLQEEVTYASEEVERLTKVLDEQDSLLQASQEQTAQKNAMIHKLEQKVYSTPQYYRWIILQFIFNAFLILHLFCTRSGNNTKRLNIQSEIEVWNSLLSCQAHQSHYLK